MRGARFRDIMNICRPRSREGETYKSLVRVPSTYGALRTESATRVAAPRRMIPWHA